MKLYRTIIFGLFIILNSGNTEIIAQSEVKNWELGGYIKDMQTVLNYSKSDLAPEGYMLYDNLLHNRINFGYYPDEHLSFELDVRNRVFWSDFIRSQPDTYIEGLDGANDFFNLSYGEAGSQGMAFHTMIDRLYVDYTTGNWQFRIGRQRINWGINTAWNPNDIFNAYSFTDFDYEEKPGSDAILAKYYFNFASSLELAVKAFDKKEEAVAAILFKWNKWTYDMQLLAGIMQNNYVLGGGWAGNFFDAGFKGEISYFKAIDEEEEDGFAATLGVDYIFPNSLFANIGFLYNHNGVNDQSFAQLFEFELSAKNLYPYKTAFFGSVNYSFNPLFGGGIMLAYSPVETHPLFLSPNLSYSLSNDLDFALFGQLLFEKDEKFKSPVQAFFIRFKYSY